MKRKLTAIIIAAMLIVSAAGCGNAAETTTTTEATTTTTTTAEVTTTTTTTTAEATTTEETSAEDDAADAVDTTDGEQTSELAFPEGATECDGALVKAFYQSMFTGDGFRLCLESNGSAVNSYKLGDKLYMSVEANGTAAMTVLVADGKSYTMFDAQKMALMQTATEEALASFNSMSAPSDLNDQLATAKYAEAQGEYNGTACTIEYAIMTESSGEKLAGFYFDAAGTCVALVDPSTEVITAVTGYGAWTDDTLFVVPDDYKIIDMANPSEEDLALIQSLYTTE